MLFNVTIDFRNEKALLTDGVLDSIDLASITMELERHYGIKIKMKYIDAENFDSAEAMLALVENPRLSNLRRTRAH